jgi:pimeloyl-ACP methyl ester carboxylesterase
MMPTTPPPEPARRVPTGRQARVLALAGGRRVRLIEAGAGEPLVLVHGVGLRAEAWLPQISGLSDRLRVAAVDLPGHGGSTPLSEGARLPDFVDWAIEVIGALGAGPVNLAGHSMGALVAAGVAVERPDLVRRLALLNAVFRRSAAAQAAVRQRADAIARGRLDPEAALDRWFGAKAADPALRGAVAAWLRGCDRAGYSTAYRAFAEGDATYADRWGAIGCPTLVLTGAEDPNSTPAMARAMAAACRRGRAVILDGERHLASLTAPRRVTELLGDWLAEAALPEEAAP